MAARRPRRWPWLLLAGAIAAFLYDLYGPERDAPVAEDARDAAAGDDERAVLALRAPRAEAAGARTEEPDAWYVLRETPTEARTGPDLMDLGDKVLPDKLEVWSTVRAHTIRLRLQQPSEVRALTSYVGRGSRITGVALRMPEFRFTAAEGEALEAVVALTAVPVIHDDLAAPVAPEVTGFAPSAETAASPEMVPWRELVVIARRAVDDAERAAAQAPAENGRTFRIQRLSLAPEGGPFAAFPEGFGAAFFDPDGSSSGHLALDEWLAGTGRPGHVRRVFDVKDLGVVADASPAGDSLLAPPPFLPGQRLASMVTSSVSPESWGETGGRARVEGGELVAWSTEAVLDAVAKRLGELRAALAPRIAEHAARFAERHRAFDVSDLLGEGEGRVTAAGLVAIVTSRVDPASWRLDGRVEVRGHLLVVRQEPSRMAEVEALLARLREALRRPAGAAAAAPEPRPASDG